MSLGVWQKIAEEKIKAAQERGELDDLPGSGKPLDLEDDSHIAPELRLAYKVLKNAGYTPPELEAQKEIHQLEELLSGAPDEKTRYRALKRLNFLAMKLGELRPHSALLDEHRYASRIVARLVKSRNGK